MDVFMEMRFRFPRYIPAPPMPAITLPKMRAFMLGAAPQIALPIAKAVTQPTCSHLTLKIPYAFPLSIISENSASSRYITYKVKIVAIEPNGNPLANQVNLEISPNEPRTADWMSAAIVLSNPYRKPEA
jgi:hypothetical protein